MSPERAAAAAGPPRPAEQVWAVFLHALDRLPADARQVLLLHDIGGIPVEALLPLLGLSDSVCRQHLERAHARLQAHARPLGAPPSCP